MTAMHPTLLIGLDGATFTVLDPLIRAGHMPNLARLMDKLMQRQSFIDTQPR